MANAVVKSRVQPGPMRSRLPRDTPGWLGSTDVSRNLDSDAKDNADCIGSVDPRNDPCEQRKRMDLTGWWRDTWWNTQRPDKRSCFVIGREHQLFALLSTVVLLPTWKAIIL